MCRRETSGHLQRTLVAVACATKLAVHTLAVLVVLYMQDLTNPSEVLNGLRICSPVRDVFSRDLKSIGPNRA